MAPESRVTRGPSLHMNEPGPKIKGHADLSRKLRSTVAGVRRTDEGIDSQRCGRASAAQVDDDEDPFCRTAVSSRPARKCAERAGCRPSSDSSTTGVWPAPSVDRPRHRPRLRSRFPLPQ